MMVGEIKVVSSPRVNLDFDLFTLDNALAEAAKNYVLVKKVMLENLVTQKTESEIMREALTVRCDRGDIRSSYQWLSGSTIRLKSARMSNSSYSELP